MGTPRPHGGRARASNRLAHPQLAKTRRQRPVPNVVSVGRYEARARVRKPHRRVSALIQDIPLNETEIEQLADIPDDAQIDEATGALSPADRRTFARVRELLMKQLGSAAASRLWLVTACAAFRTTPLAAVAEGRAKRVLAVLESISEPV
jgi:hypothetical protein